MRTRRLNTLQVSRIRPLAACLAIAFNTAAHCGAPVNRSPDQPNAPQTWPVLNCHDGGADSLRDIITNHAQSGDTVDLSMLPNKCGMTDSRITLHSGEIDIYQGDLTLRGPENGTGSVTISGYNLFRVFEHSGAGKLSLYSLTIADGQYEATGNAQGGCIHSNPGGLYLHKTVVANCTASSSASTASGGAIFSNGDVKLVLSTVSGSHAVGPAQPAVGGGIHALGNLTLKYSSVSGNQAYESPAYGSEGGGAFILGDLTIVASTIDNNSASFGGALFHNSPAGVGHIVNSTISENQSTCCALLINDDSFTILNSTIAFNHSSAATSYGAAIYFGGPSDSSTLTLQSSIIANNTMGPNNTPFDLWVTPGLGTLAGADNLIMASGVASPPQGLITVTADPQLGSLQPNGGPTRAHMLQAGSPARGTGNNSLGVPDDQRGFGYPRMTDVGGNPTADMGAVQFDSIFHGDFDS